MLSLEVLHQRVRVPEAFRGAAPILAFSSRQRASSSSVTKPQYTFVCGRSLSLSVPRGASSVTSERACERRFAPCTLSQLFDSDGALFLSPPSLPSPARAPGRSSSFPTPLFFPRRSRCLFGHQKKQERWPSWNASSTCRVRGWAREVSGVCDCPCCRPAPPLPRASRTSRTWQSECEGSGCRGLVTGCYVRAGTMLPRLLLRRRPEGRRRSSSAR